MSDEPVEQRGRLDSQGQGGLQDERAEGEERGAEFSRRIKVKARRKLWARQTQDREAQTIWSGLSMIGLVGWGVSVPTLLGVALGIWLDQRFPGEHSWTLTLLLAGLLIGCLNAWHWVTREERVTRRRDGQEAGKQQERGEQVRKREHSKEEGEGKQR